jgi:hypothetical protein
MTGFRIEPLDRDDDWTCELVRESDGVVVGWFKTAERAQAAADNGGEPPAPPVEERPFVEVVNQFDLFGGIV